MTKALTVADLVAHLQTLDQTMPVAYELFSEQTLLQLSDLNIENLCEPRNDGWVQDARPDMPTIPYLVFPGN